MFAAEIVNLKEQNVQLEAKVRELTARLNQDSSNSSKPPSTDPFWKRPPFKPPSTRHQGGQPGHPGHHFQDFPPELVTSVESYIPETCQHCGTSLPKAPGPNDPPPIRHQVAELPPPKVQVTEHQGHARICPVCKKLTQKTIPPSVLAHRFGPSLTALLSFLCARCHCSKRQVVELAQTLYGLPISLGSVSALEAEMSAALEAPYAELTATVRGAPVLHVDETGWFKRGLTCWLWMAGTAREVLFKVEPSRNWPSLRVLLGEEPKNFVCSDRWHAYNHIPMVNRQICWAHLLRDFQARVDFDGGAEVIGHAGLRAAEKLFAAWHEFTAQKISRQVLQALLAPVRDQLRKDLEYARDGPIPKAARFARRLLTCEEAMWKFAYRDGIEPTNNHAERQLRPSVLWRLRCFGSQSDRGCRFAERLLSVVQTLRLQKRSVLEYLTAAVDTYRAGLPAPLLAGV